MNRRDFITLAGGAAAWPMVAQGQSSAKRTIGFLSSQSARNAFSIDTVAAFRKGLEESGFFEGSELSIQFLFAENRLDQLDSLANELVAKKVDVIATIGGPQPIKAVEATTSTIPVVFVFGGDPVIAHLVDSLNRPGKNVTGVTFFTVELAAKRFEWLREIVPEATKIGLLNDPSVPSGLEPSATAGVHMISMDAVSELGLDAAFARFKQENVQALFVGTGAFFNTVREAIISRALSLAVPASFPAREFVELGGLMSYGADINDAVRLGGIQAAAILKGRRPADLPVLQPTTFQFAINLKTARGLGVTVPQSLLVAATEVIE